jgi:hypothetical protein
MWQIIAKVFNPIVRAFRTATTPPAMVSTDEVMHVAELEIDEIHPALARARSMVGKGRYCLGAGGKRPDADHPWSTCAKPSQHAHRDLGTSFSDCSGFTNWCHRLPRHDKANDVWLNSDEIERRGKAQGIAWKDALPGDVVAYGNGKAIGHVGIVSEVDDAGPVKVIHCQASKKPAVIETSADLFVHKKAVIWRPGRP